ncbi:hypothetical protein ACFE04_006291 [Oxalis oulophora]
MSGALSRNIKIDDPSEIYSALGLYETCPGNQGSPRILMLLSTILEKEIHRNEGKTTTKSDMVTLFHGTRPPTMNIQPYLRRILRYTRCSPSCLVVAYIYINRYLQRWDGFLTSLNAHRLLITSVLLAAKFIHHELYVDIDVFDRYCLELQREETKRRSQAKNERGYDKAAYLNG